MADCGGSVAPLPVWLRAVIDGAGPKASVRAHLLLAPWPDREGRGAPASGLLLQTIVERVPRPWRPRSVVALTDVAGSGGERAQRDAAIAEIVPLAAAGNEAAFTRLVTAFNADMARVAYVVCGGDRELAQDAVQSAWTIAWSRLRTLREPGHVRPWLLSVTANEARQLLRRQRRVVAVGMEYLEDRVGTPDPDASAGSLDVAALVARLSPDERALVGLRYAAGLDSGEIGALLGISASGVRSRLDRLLDRLRAELADD